MNHDPVYLRLRETAWRRKLTAAEQAELHAYLAAHPQLQSDWALEAALSDALTRLPDTLVPSNFAARVLQAVDRESVVSTDTHPLRWRWSWRVLLPRLAVTAAVAALGLIAFEHYEASRRAALAKHLVAVYGGKPLPSLEELNNFEAIRRLNAAPQSDRDLLSSLQ